MDCAAVTKLQLPDVRISDATTYQPSQSIKVTHCQVNGIVGREIRFRVLLPDEWNQRFVMGGGGGFVGSVDNQAQATINAGYATAGTDTGHQGFAFSAAWALNDLERQVNFGHLAVHRVAEVAKAIVAAYYQTPARRSYFIGCSNGGRQAMMEAQRYPDDFDGIVAGAPALDFVGIGAQFIRDSRALYPDSQKLGESPLGADALTLVESSVVAACDANDGVTDGIVDDPRACRFDVDSIATCNGPGGPGCLTAAQKATLKEIYSPTRNAGGEIRVAQPLGGESEADGWRTWITGTNELVYKMAKAPSLRYAFGTEFFKYFVFNDPAWDYTKYDLSNWNKDTKLAATVLNATNPNLDAIKAKGRKVIMWHGWSDPALTALASVQYYEQVQARDPNVREYFRTFMMPGVLHCAGGPGADRADWAGVISDWVEKGTAPDAIIASKIVDGKTVRTRPLCPYPQRAVYKGAGSTDDAANFACQVP
jgi:feruloyl esterase